MTRLGEMTVTVTGVRDSIRRSVERLLPVMSGRLAERRELLERVEGLISATGIHPSMAIDMRDMRPVGERISGPREKVNWKEEGF